MNFFHRYKLYQDRINKKLSSTLNNLPFQESNLLQAMKYSIFSGGKRFRSCLVYITGKMFKVNIITLDAISAAIECIHSYSLIHDDLPCMDNDDYRRGKLSCHIKYNESISLLAGDALQSLAFDILAKDTMPGVSNFKRISILSELSSAIGSSGMCIGQALDLESKTKKINLSELENINLYKTAFLIRSSTRLAYLSSNNSSKSILSALDYFSSSIGLAFQIQDDVLDSQDISFAMQDNKKKYQNTYLSLKKIKKLKKRIEELSEEAFFALKVLKKNNLNIDLLEQLTHFIIKRIE